MKLMNAYETMKLSNRCEIINWRRWACETFVASRYSATKRHLLSVSISAPYSGPQSCTTRPPAWLALRVAPHAPMAGPKSCATRQDMALHFTFCWAFIYRSVEPLFIVLLNLCLSFCWTFVYRSVEPLFHVLMNLCVNFFWTFVYRSVEPLF